MSTPPLSDPSLPELTGPGSRWAFWQWLIEPASSVTGRGTRRQVRLLSLLLLVLIPLTFIGVALRWLFAATQIIDYALLVALLGLGTAYGLSRTRHHRIAAFLIAGVTFSVPLLLGVLIPNYSSGRLLSSLVWLVVAVLVGFILFSMRGVLVLTAVSVLTLILLPVAFPQIEFVNMIVPLILIGAVSALILLAAHYRDQVEKDRLFELSAANRELQSLRASLEQRIADRTAELASANTALQTQIAGGRQIEAALQHSEALFRALFEYSPDAIWLIDPRDPANAWPIIDCNPMACQMHGYKREELIGQPINIVNEFIGQTDRSEYFQRLHEERYFKYEVNHRHKSGLIFSVEVATSLINVGGRELVLGIDRDITGRKRGEEALRRQNSFLEALHETTLGLLRRLNLKSLLETIISRAAQFVGTPHGYIYLLDFEEEEPEMEAKVGIGLCREDIGSRIKPGEGVSGQVWLMRQPLVVDDYDRWPGRIPNMRHGAYQCIMGVPLLSGDEVIGVIGLVYDVTAGRTFGEAEVDLLSRFAQLAALALDNARLYTAIQEHAAENAALYRASFQLLNPGTDLPGLAEQIAEAVTHEFALANCSVLLVDESGAQLQRVGHAGPFKVTGALVIPIDGPGLTAAAAREGQMIYAPDVATDTRYLAKDSRTLSELVMPLKIGERVIGVLDLQSPERDAFDEPARRIITAFAKHAELALENGRLVANLAQAYHRLQEEQEKLLAAERMASLGRLSADIAHEISTPLSAARASLSTVRELVEEYQAAIGDLEVTADDHREIARDMLKSIQLADTGAEKVAGFVRGIKDRIRGVSTGERHRFNAVPVIRDALILLGYALRHNNCTADFDYDVEKLELYGAPGRLAQVITNLVTNAIDANSAKGGGAINLQLRRAAAGVQLQVSDAGDGIPPELISKIFEPMFTTKPLGQGTGLGLTIVHNIVTEHFGGAIDIVSPPGEGATFIIHFPPVQEDSHGPQN